MKKEVLQYIKLLKAFRIVYRARYFLSGLVVVEMMTKVFLKAKTARKVQVKVTPTGNEPEKRIRRYKRKK